MAARRSPPIPLDAEKVMARIRALEIEEDANQIPLLLYFGGAAAAAAAALGVSVIAATAWSDISDPFAAITSLSDIVDTLL